MCEKSIAAGTQHWTDLSIPRAVVDAASCELATADIGLEHGAGAILVAGDADAVKILQQRDGVFTGQAS
jgi:hypothetical protein